MKLIERTYVASVIGLCLVAVLSSDSRAQQLLGYWKFDETSDDQMVMDSSGNERHGEFEGDVDPNVEGAPGYGSGVYLNGIDGRVWLGPGDENGFGDITEDFTVMAWINPDQFDSKNRVFGSAPWEANSGWGWGTVGDQLEITTWGVRDYDQPVPLELDEWAHVAVTLDADFTATFYHMGEFIGELTHDGGGGPTINDFYIGYAAVDAEHFSGLLDEVAIFEGVLTEEQIANAMNLGVENWTGMVDPLAPLDDGSLTDPTERAAYVRDVLNTWIGDSNLDGEFNSGDFVFVFTAGQYEDNTPDNSNWASGDWNGDGDFDSSDFVAAFTDGGFEQGPRAAAVAAVPEPSSLILLGLGGLLCVRRRTHGRSRSV